MRAKCPRGVNPADFKHMLSNIPGGFVLKRHYREGIWMNFVFSYTGRRNPRLEEYDFKRGDEFETAIVCKRL